MFIRNGDLHSTRSAAASEIARNEVCCCVLLRTTFSKKHHLRSADHREFASETIPKIAALMATLLGQPVRRSSRLVISFNGTV